MRFGYPKRIAFQGLVNACKPIEEKLKKTCVEQSNFYTKVLLSIGFHLKDFKIGKDTIFFRSNKIHLMEVFFSNIKTVRMQKNWQEVSESHLPDSLIPKQSRKPK